MTRSEEEKMKKAIYNACYGAIEKDGDERIQENVLVLGAIGRNDIT